MDANEIKKVLIGDIDKILNTVVFKKGDSIAPGEASQVLARPDGDGYAKTDITLRNIIYWNSIGTGSFMEVMLILYERRYGKISLKEIETLFCQYSHRFVNYRKLTLQPMMDFYHVRLEEEKNKKP